MTHAAHLMHDNSLAAYRSEEPRLSKRICAILDWLRQNGAATDRQVAYGMGFGENLNAVRPRCTELVLLGILVEIGNRKCPTTGKTVRVLDVVRDRQGDLFCGH